VTGGGRYWLGLGANLGDRLATLRAAVAWLDGHGAAVEAASRVYETAPRDLEDQPDFLNAACRVRTALGPSALLALVKRMEEELGRVPGVRFGPRALDCDLLVWDGGEVSLPDLEIPHPRLAARRFALLPLLDLDPGLTLPSGARVADLADAIPDAEQPVRPVGPGAGLR
jgi:2-amino-4-hydroxy-6-hydroxymethyldihydropteridine diphosphokinase